MLQADASFGALLPPENNDAHLQVNISRGSAAEEEEGDNLATAAGVAKGKVVSAMMRKHVVEGMVPILAELKRMLQEKKHPLLSNMMATLRVLLKDHKSEVKPSQLHCVHC